METSDLEKAVHAVLPALNLEPAGFQLDRGFLLRAQRSARPIVMVLNNVASQFVFVGLRETSDPDSAVGGIAEEALGCLPKRSRDFCERLFVAWIDTHDRVFAAALVVASPARVGKILGVSWSPPEAWP